jgi:succinate dehydrogenase hydrophobic anchor subunit
MKAFKLILRIILVLLIVVSVFMFLIINASSHDIKTGMKISPLLFIFFFLFLFYLTKYMNPKE